MMLKYFNLKEFASPDLKWSGNYMDSLVLNMFDVAREIAGIPFKINSGYRTKNHNKAVRGNDNSAHLRGLAADIECYHSSERFLIVSALIRAGFSRIGIYENFIHADHDLSLPINLIWYE